MTTATFEITQQALDLPADERALLALHLWRSVEHFVDPDVERAWVREAEARWTEIHENAVTCLSAEDVMQQARAALKR